MYKKPRILVEGLSNNFGGTEAVISNYVKALSADFVFDFVIEHPLKNHLDLLLGNNSQIIIPNRHANPIKFYRRLNWFMQETAHLYDACWINKNNFGNTSMLSFSRKYGIPKRVLHIHSLTPGFRRRYQTLIDGINEPKAKLDATDYWVCSSDVGEKYFKGSGYKVMPNAFDFSSFYFSCNNRNKIRNKYKVSDDELLIGTVGRIEERKNQLFLLDVVKELLNRGLKAKLMIVGDGPLRGAISCKASDAGISESVLLPGEVSNPAMYLSAFDVFAFPSLSEGLGIAAIEAQINGLPCVVSDTLSDEIKISSEITYLPLANSMAWVNVIENKKRSNVTLIKSSERFNIHMQVNSIKQTFLS